MEECEFAFTRSRDKTLNRLRKTKNIHTRNSSSSFNSISESSAYVSKPDIAYNPLYEPEPLENNNRTLKELATLDSYELKSRLIHLLPKFHGLAGEDPHKHLKEFHVVCFTLRLQGIPEDYIKMKAFTFSLDGATKDWMYLQPIMFNIWGDMKLIFLEKFFPTSKTKEICGIRQHFGRHCTNIDRGSTSCVPRVRTIKSANNFYCRLLMMDRNMVDAANGGVLMDKTPTTATHLISNMASNTQHFGTRGGAITSRVVSEVGAFDNLRLENQLAELTSLVRGGVGVVMLHSGRELLHQTVPQRNLRPTDVETKPRANSRVQQLARSIPLPFPTRTVSARKSETDEDLLKLFRKVEINIPLLDTIKQVPKYAKFLKELCIHKRKKMKGAVEMGGIMSALIKHKNTTTRAQ
ncbi:hypothetical protein CR513_03866, partial [Mucuna pruriens]